MNLWLQNGKVVIDSSGKPIICDNCPCLTGTPCSDQSPDQTTQPKVRITAGAACPCFDGDITGCYVWLSYNAGTSTWTWKDYSGCTNPNSYFTFTLQCQTSGVNTGKWKLTVQGYLDGSPTKNVSGTTYGFLDMDINNYFDGTMDVVLYDTDIVEVCTITVVFNDVAC